MTTCPKCGHEFEAVAPPQAITVPTLLVGEEEWQYGMPGGSSEDQVAHFAAMGYEMNGLAVAKTHQGKQWDGTGPIAYLGDGPRYRVTFLLGGGEESRWFLHHTGWGTPWGDGWRFSVRKLPTPTE